MAQMHLGPQQYPFRRGDRIRVSTRSSVTTPNKVFVRVRYEDGEKDRFEIPITHAGDRANEISFSPDTFLRDGFVEALTVDTSIVARGECYLAIQVDNENEQLHYPLFAGYVTPVHTPLGFFEHPHSGEGLRQILPVAADIAPVDITQALAAANTLRKVTGFVWYYHASNDAANRTILASLRNIGRAFPTGFTEGSNSRVRTFPAAGAMTLTADQEGLVYARSDRKDGFVVAVDTGAITAESAATAPSPFPMWVTSDDLAEILFDVTLAEAADRHSIYLFTEEWAAP